MKPRASGVFRLELCVQCQHGQSENVAPDTLPKPGEDWFFRGIGKGMVGTWKVLEDGKGSRVGSHISWSADDRKGPGELRTSQDVLGNSFPPLEMIFFGTPTFQEFSKGTFPDLWFVKEKLALQPYVDTCILTDLETHEFPSKSRSCGCRCKVAHWGVYRTGSRG